MPKREHVFTVLVLAIAGCVVLVWVAKPTGDDAYLQCLKPVLRTGDALFHDLEYTTKIAGESPRYYCSLWADAGPLYQRTVDLRDQLQRCPPPTTQCLRDYDALMREALSQDVDGIARIESWCLGGGKLNESTLILGTPDDLARALQLKNQATVVLDACLE